MKVLLLLPRRIGRVVDCGSLENYCTERYRGFESLILRQKIKGLSFEAFFCEKKRGLLTSEKLFKQQINKQKYRSES